MSENPVKLQEALQHLAKLRKEEEHLLAQYEACNQNVIRTPEWIAMQEINEQRSAKKHDIEILVDGIKQAALAEYQATKQKDPITGITVKIYKVIKYDAEKAEAWAKEKMPEMLVLDEKAFEKYAKAVADVAPVPCVEYLDDPRPQIASDLSDYLPQEPTSEEEPF
jgi:hypothetical protein